MSKFVEFPERQEAEFDRPQYVRFVEGMPIVIRILDNKAYHVRKHWINRQKISLLCLGDACPICANNERIRREEPKNFRNVKGYIPLQNRYMVNVLDRTPVVIDPETGDEYNARKGTFPPVTEDGERSLVGIEPVPSNKIKILERGRQLFENLLAIHEETAKFDDDGELVSGGLTTFDIKFSTIGSGTDMTISAIPLIQNDDDISSILEETGQEKHVLSTIGIQLTPREMEKVAYQGVSLADIFAERRAEDESETPGEVSAELLADSESRVESLFGDSDDYSEDEED